MDDGEGLRAAIWQDQFLPVFSSFRKRKTKPAVRYNNCMIVKPIHNLYYVSPYKQVAGWKNSKQVKNRDVGLRS